MTNGYQKIHKLIMNNKVQFVEAKQV